MPAEAGSSGGSTDGDGATALEQLPVSSRFLIAMFLGIAIWNSLEMVPLVYMTFRRYRTLYFWSLCVATLGVPICAVAQILNIWVPSSSGGGYSGNGTALLPIIISSVGWVPMVTGQSLVLYSRLHLLNTDPRTLRLLLAMIVFDGVVLHSVGIVLTFGANSAHPDRWTAPYGVFEKVQVTVFFAQEATLSALYLYKSRAFLGRYPTREHEHRHRHQHQQAPRLDRSARAVRAILTWLIVVNVLVLAIDVTILVLENLGLHLVQLAYKIFAYSVKLKCEIGILNRLVEFVRCARRLDLDDDDDGRGGLRTARGSCNAEMPHFNAELQREWESTLERTFGVASGETPEVAAGSTQVTRDDGTGTGAGAETGTGTGTRAEHDAGNARNGSGRASTRVEVRSVPMDVQDGGGDLEITRIHTAPSQDPEIKREV